jgi:hypothetical protein
MSDNDSFNQGLRGTGPTGNTNWDDYQRGKSIRDWNQQALSSQGNVADSSLLGAGGESFGSPLSPAGSPLGDFVASVATGADEDYEVLPVLPGVPGIAAALLVAPVVLVLLPLWGVLYPLSGAATLIGAASVGKIIGGAAPTLKPDDVQVFAVATGAILVFVCTRLEQVFSRIGLYRYIRYALRFVTYGFVATAMLLPGPGISGWIRSPELASAILRDPRSLAVVGAITLGMHWFSRRRGPRRLWHLLLATAKLRSPVER